MAIFYEYENMCSKNMYKEQKSVRESAEELLHYGFIEQPKQTSKAVVVPKLLTSNASIGIKKIYKLACSIDELNKNANTILHTYGDLKIKLRNLVTLKNEFLYVNILPYILRPNKFIREENCVGYVIQRRTDNSIIELKIDTLQKDYFTYNIVNINWKKTNELNAKGINSVIFDYIDEDKIKAELAKHNAHVKANKKYSNSAESKRFTVAYENGKQILDIILKLISLGQYAYTSFTISGITYIPFCSGYRVGFITFDGTDCAVDYATSGRYLNDRTMQIRARDDDGYMIDAKSEILGKLTGTNISEVQQCGDYYLLKLKDSSVIAYKINYGEIKAFETTQYNEQFHTPMQVLPNTVEFLKNAKVQNVMRDIGCIYLAEELPKSSKTIIRYLATYMHYSQDIEACTKSKVYNFISENINYSCGKILSLFVLSQLL